MEKEQRYRLRVILALILLATLPCYCTGYLLVRVEEGLASRPSATPSLPPTSTQIPSATALPSWTPVSSLTNTPITPTATPSLTPTVFHTWTPSSTPPPSATATPTNTEIPSPTFTATFTSPPPSETPLTPAVTDTVVPYPLVSPLP